MAIVEESVIDVNKFCVRELSLFGRESFLIDADNVWRVRNGIWALTVENLIDGEVARF